MVGLWELKETAVLSFDTLRDVHKPGKGRGRHKKRAGLGWPQQASLLLVPCRREDRAGAGLSALFQGQKAKLVCQ